MFKFIQLLNFKDFILVSCILLGGATMLIYAKSHDIQHHVYSADKEEYPVDNGVWTKRAVGSNTTITAPDSIHTALGVTITSSYTTYNLIADSCGVDTFKNIGWVVEYNQDSIPIFTNIGKTRMWIIYKYNSWYEYWPTIAVKDGYLTARPRLIVFLSGINVITAY